MTDRKQQAEAIYDAYPRKAARPRALKAIGRALAIELMVQRVIDGAQSNW